MAASSVLLLRGIVGIAVGLLAMVWPGLPVSSKWQRRSVTRRELQREWILVLSGILLVAVALRLRTGRLVTA